MCSNGVIVDLARATGDRDAVGGKAAVLAELAAAGLPVPPGFVVTVPGDGDGFDQQLGRAAQRAGGELFAVRSSAVAEDLADASYAGLYETYLNVRVDGLGEAVRRCFAAASSDRVAAYHARRGGGRSGMAVLVQAMIDPVAAGVAFTAHPVTGDRDRAVVTAVPGLADALVSGETVGEEWEISTRDVRITRAFSRQQQVLTPGRARAVAELARRVADRYARPQDVEWALGRDGTLWLLQARPMTALPEPISWNPPGPGLWMRNFRLGEWLPEAVTPLFATWLLPAIEDGYLDGMHACLAVRVPFRYALVNGWYYNATPVPSPALLARVLWQGRGRAVRTAFNALIRVSRNPAAADRAVLSELYRRWREDQLPRYRRLVRTAEQEAGTAPVTRLVRLVDRLAVEAGVYLWYLAVVGGSAWKMEACLTRFARRHLATTVPDRDGGAQVLLRGLPGTRPVATRHAVHSVDWYHPVVDELATGEDLTAAGSPGSDLARQRIAAERACRTALADRPRTLARFDRLLDVNQRYATIREQQARDFTLAWPVLRTCAHRIGRHLTDTGALADPRDIFFCTRDEANAALSGNAGPLAQAVLARRDLWQSQRRLAAPLTLGRPVRLIGDVIDRAVQAARGGAEIGENTIAGHPASAGRATGRVRILQEPEDVADFRAGDVLVARATTPAWTPLFARAAAVVTDGGTLAAHASLVAREYAIPAVVGTGDATRRLQPGQLVTVDGTNGTVVIHTDAVPPRA